MRSSAAASEPWAEEAAHRILTEEGTSGEALIAAFLAAAAARPGALWSPVQILVAGPGTFARAFDGRARQPGLGLRRPRGFVKAGAVPEAAYVAAPASLGALGLVHAYDGSLSFQKLATPALEHARAIGASERRALLARIARMGPSALWAPVSLRPVLAAAGRAEGGLLSERDLTEVRPESALPREIELPHDRSALVVPWSATPMNRPVEIVVAADARGVFGVLAYAPDDEGVSVPELGLRLPRDAVPVRRGVPRLAPGEALPFPAPIAIGLTAHLAAMALGACSPAPFSVADVAAIWSDPHVTAAQLLAAARDAASGSAAFAVVRSHKSPRVQKLSLAAGR